MRMGPDFENRPSLRKSEVAAILRQQGVDLHDLDQNEQSRVCACAATAPAILTDASKAEEDITPRLESICSAIGGALVGLEHKLQSLPSLCRKIAFLVADDANISLHNIRSHVTDALRYTILFDVSCYTDGVQEARERLELAGFRARRVRNYWAEGNIYKGINSLWVEGYGLVFEIRFHTPESFKLKESILHPLYEKCRVLESRLTPISSGSNLLIRKEIKQLKQKMQKQSDSLEIPLGAEFIGED